MVTAVVIDDEKKARENTVHIIQSFTDNVELLGEAGDVSSGVALIREKQPDIVFLDIRMPDGDGFSLLNQFDPICFKVIFITAYDQYAVEAFKFSALDYLLKPIDPDDLVDAVENASKSIQQEDMGSQLQAFMENSQKTTEGKETKKMVFKTAENIYVVNIIDIIRCESDENYTQIFLKDGKKILVSKTLKEYDELLKNYGFFRVHKSHLVNVDYIDRFHKGDGGYLVLKNNDDIPVSQRKREVLMKYLDKI